MSHSLPRKNVGAIGLMSGTSADGVDAALVSTDGEKGFEFHDFVSVPYQEDFRAELLEIAQRDVSIDRILLAEKLLTDCHVEACQRLLGENASREIHIIGFHGHTIRHIPDQSVTCQIGDASRLAERTGISVVSDFRRRDLAAGGQGAPLAPLFHQLMMRDQRKPAMMINLGGVANITWVDENDNIVAGDAGPGCGLLDAWVLERTGEPFDVDGVHASKGLMDENAVARVRDHSFVRLPLPKSADRFQFDDLVPSEAGLEDGAATLCGITAEAIYQCTSRLRPPLQVWVSGGGSKHPIMMRELKKRFPNVEPVESLGCRAVSLEAECFAWLAVRRLRGLPTSLPSTTGCSHPTSGGSITSPGIRNIP